MRVCASSAAKGSSIEQHVRLVREERGRWRSAGACRPTARAGISAPQPSRLDELDEMADPLLPLGRRQALAVRAVAEAELDILHDRLPGEEGVVLEDHAALGPGPDDRRPSMAMLPAGRHCSSPAIMLRIVVLPQPEGPTMRQELARLDVEVDDLDRDDGCLARARQRECLARRLEATASARPVRVVSASSMASAIAAAREPAVDEQRHEPDRDHADDDAVRARCCRRRRRTSSGRCRRCSRRRPWRRRRARPR